MIEENCLAAQSFHEGCRHLPQRMSDNTGHALWRSGGGPADENGTASHTERRPRWNGSFTPRSRARMWLTYSHSSAVRTGFVPSCRAPFLERAYACWR